jgi:hypothetical protein
VRKLVPLPVCTSTVAADEPPAAAGEDAGADVPADAGVDAEPFVPLLQAAARTAAAAIGRPILRANEILLDSSSLFICCAFPFGGNIERSGECLCITQYVVAANEVRRIGYVTYHRVIRRRCGIH